MAQQTDQQTLKPYEVRRVFRRHRGAQTRLATELGVSRSHVSKWMKGSAVSSRIAEAATKMARSLEAA